MRNIRAKTKNGPTPSHCVGRRSARLFAGGRDFSAIAGSERGRPLMRRACTVPVEQGTIPSRQASATRPSIKTSVWSEIAIQRKALSLQRCERETGGLNCLPSHLHFPTFAPTTVSHCL